MRNFILAGFIVWASISVSTDAFGQCGVQAMIRVLNDGWNNPEYLADSSIVQPGWKIYSYQWNFNDDTTSSNNYAVFHPYDPPLGYNKVCLKVWATDTVTGDSCYSSYCNIFEGAGQIAWIVIVIDSVGPLTYKFDVTKNNYYPFNGNFLLKFGDGDTTHYYDDQMGINSYTHTYPSAGNYIAELTFYGFTPYGIDVSANALIHVDNGIKNISYVSAVSNFSDCDSISVGAISNPVVNGFIFAAVHGNKYNFQVPFDLLTSFTGSFYKNIPTFPTPGVKLLKAEFINPNGGQSYQYVGALTQNCGIIPDTIRGKVFADADADGVLDSNETGISGKKIELDNYSATTDSLGNYELIKPNESVNIELAGTNSYFVTIPHHGYYNYITQPIQNYNFGISVYTTSISGKAYMDYNKDSIYNAGDQLLGNVSLEFYNTTLLRSYYTSTNMNGNYSILLPSGNYILRPATSVLDSAYFYPDSILISSPLGGTFTNMDFACNTLVPGANLNVSIGCSSAPRPGFNCYLSANVSNTGIDSTFGKVIIHYDSNLYFDSISPPGSLVDTINHIIEWQTGYIKVNAGKDYQLFCVVPSTLPIGTIITSDVRIVPDTAVIENDSLNNYFALNQMVIGSFDPNDKLVSPTGIGGNSAVYHHQRLHYRINFQNTGTASAINVIIQDILNENLDISTILMENSSHPYSFFIDDRTITWKFLNIHLPDSNANEPLSHGFIEFSMVPYQGLPDGTTIENNASIYFDFNAPVVTNNVQNTLQTNIPCDSVISVQNLQTSYCYGDTLTACILHLAPLNYLWLIDSVMVSDKDSVSISTLTPGNHNFIVTAGNNTCSNIFNFSVNIFPSMVLNLGNDTSTCFSSVFLDAGSGFVSYQWNTGDTVQGITAALSGNYAVVIVDSNGCVKKDSIQITINALPALELGNDTSSCNNYILLNAGGGFANYQWSTGASTQTIGAYSTNTYSVTVTDVHGCTNSDQIKITINPIPTLLFNAFNTDTVCINSAPLTINDGTPGGGVFSGNGVVGNIFDPYSAGAGWHLIAYEYVDSLGCSNVISDSVFVDLCMNVTAYQGNAEITIFPNPSSGQIHLICSEKFLPCEVNIFDVLGVNLKNIKCSNLENSIDISALPSGNYLLMVQNKNVLSIIQRIVKL